MVDFAKAGNSYRVISDDLKFFEPGDIVVALESDYVPYCVHKKDYHGLISTENPYPIHKYNPLMGEELEEIE